MCTILFLTICLLNIFLWPFKMTVKSVEIICLKRMGKWMSFYNCSNSSVFISMLEMHCLEAASHFSNNSVFIIRTRATIESLVANKPSSHLAFSVIQCWNPFYRTGRWVIVNLLWTSVVMGNYLLQQPFLFQRNPTFNLSALNNMFLYIVFFT